MENLKRKLFDQLVSHLDKKQFTIVVGARQTGKTTLLKQLESFLLKQSKAVHFFNLEDFDLLESLNSHPLNILNFINLQQNEKVYLLIDEVQYLKDPSNFLKLIYDEYPGIIKIIATGSSAFYIDRKFKDSLAGRKQIFYLYTLDFDEFVYFRTRNLGLISDIEKIRQSKDYQSLKRKEISRLFDEYLTFGGYPAVVLAQNQSEKINYLKEISSSFLKKDIEDNHVYKPDELYNLIRVLASQAGNLLNKKELTNTLRLSETAIDNYLYILRKSFHIHLVRPYYRNIRKELTKMPKIYFHDMGFRNILIKQFGNISYRLDKGQLVENYLFVRLRQMHDLEDIFYWRTADGNEIDFVISPDFRQGYAIESKYGFSEIKYSKYTKFLKAYPEFNLHFRCYEGINNETSLIGL